MQPRAMRNVCVISTQLLCTLWSTQSMHQGCTLSQNTSWASYLPCSTSLHAKHFLKPASSSIPPPRYVLFNVWCWCNCARTVCVWLRQVLYLLACVSEKASLQFYNELRHAHMHDARCSTRTCVMMWTGNSLIVRLQWSCECMCVCYNMQDSLNQGRFHYI